MDFQVKIQLHDLGIKTADLDSTLSDRHNLF